MVMITMVMVMVMLLLSKKQLSFPRTLFRVQHLPSV